MLTGQDQERARRPASPPSRRFGRRLGAWPLSASLLTHAAVAVAAIAIVASHVGPRRTAPPPPVPVVVLTPTPTPTKPVPKAQGDLAVRARPTPTPVPSPTPTPRPSAKPSPAPRPTPRPKPTPKPKLTAEQHQFKIMRQIPYFKTMTDAQLRKQKLPPGLKSWDQIGKIGKQLDALNWLFLPPETGQHPEPQAQGSPNPSAIPSGMPSPLEQVDEQGNHTLTFEDQQTNFEARWKEGDTQASVSYKPVDAPPDEPAKTFEVPVSEDRQKFLTDIMTAYLNSLFGEPGSPSPSPTP